jgi:hypothetical protein
MNYTSTFWSLLLLALCACSKPAHPPTEFSQRLATADRVVVTNQLSVFVSAVTPREVTRLATAVASAKQDRLPAGAMFDWDVQFYSGTNFLGVIHLQDRVFMLEDTQYSDNSGVLKTFYERLVKESQRR